MLTDRLTGRGTRWVLALLLCLLAAVSAAQTTDPLEASRALARNAERYQALGKYQPAVDQLQQALQLAGQAGDRVWEALLYGQLGGALLALQQLDAAGQALHSGLDIIATLDVPDTEAALRNNLGLLLLQRQQYPAAVSEFRRVVALAAQTGNDGLLAKAALSAAEAELQQGGDAAEVAAWTDQSALASARLAPGRTGAYLLIRNAQLLRQLEAPATAGRTTWAVTAAERLQQAAAAAEAVDDSRAAAFAYGYLGELYEQQQRYAEALTLTDTAVFMAQQVHAPELRYRWEWQQARIYLALGKDEQALAAYRRAAATLQSIRAEFTASSEHIAAGFREDAAPLFLQLADLLLRRSDTAPDKPQQQALLKEARETVELLKTTELQDYFQDDCVAAVRARIRQLDETIVPGTAVLYPIVLPGRLELLLSLQSGLVRYTVPVSGAELEAQVHLFRQRLEKRTTRQYLRQALQLYTWLIGPLESDLANNDVGTLVIVPGAALRAVPIAALHDGKDFLIRRYAVAMTPSLRLTDPRPIRRQDMTLLLNGLTESVQGFPPLVHVSSELESIQRLYGGDRYQDQSYLKDKVRQELIDKQYSIVHFATHGQFSGKVKDSFILTYDGKISMDDLEEFVGASWFRAEKPVELLTLSACETAAGDDTAALGLASVAIKAGARSALASLWSINDQASSELVSLFYKQLQDPEISKAQALQLAQVSFLEDLRYRHPSYWAPFLLIGNWL